MARQFEHGEYEDVVEIYEIFYDGHRIKPGDLIKIRDDYRIFTFSCLQHCISRDVTWINCHDPKTFKIKSFHVSKLDGFVMKRSRTKSEQRISPRKKAAARPS